MGGDRARFFPVMPSDSKRNNRHKLKCWKCSLNMNNINNTSSWGVEGGQTLEKVVQTGCGITILGDIENLTGHSSEQPGVGESALSRNVGLDHLPATAVL